MPQTVEVPGVGVIEFPDEMNQTQIASAILSVTKGRQAQKRPILEGVGRQFGLTARYGLEGAPALVDMLSAPFRHGIESLTGRRVPPLAETTTGWANSLGLPNPENEMERVVGEGARMMAGTAPVIRGSQAIASSMDGGARRVIEQLATRPTSQLASSAASGTASQAAKESGSGPGGQVAASFVAGMATPMAIQSAQNSFGTMRNFLNAKTSPKLFDAVLRNELIRAGIDWETLSAQARESLRKDVQSALYSGQPLDSAGLRRLADFRRIGAEPLLGDVTMNPRDVTLQRNLAKQLANQRGFGGAADLPDIQNRNAKTVLNTISGAADSPLDAYATGDRLIRQVQGQDAAMSAGVRGLYDQARSAAGRDIPLDRAAFVNEAFDNLVRENKTAFLPENVKTLLNQISSGKINVNGREVPTPFDVNTVDQLKTILSNAAQSGDGNTRAAVKAVRMALDNIGPTPIKNQFGGNQAVTGQMGAAMAEADTLPAIALEKFDAARRAAKGQFQWREGAKFIEDALGGATPDNFVKKHVLNASAEELSKVRQFVGKDKDLTEAIKKQMVDYIMARGRADGDIGAFSSAGMQDALKSIGYRKLGMFFSGKEMADLDAAVNVARSMQAQPMGSAVNNSNSAAMLTGKFADFMGRASGVPVVGPMVADPLQGLALSFQARNVRNVGQGLVAPRPGVGFGENMFPVPVGLFGGLAVMPPGQDDHR